MPEDLTPQPGRESALDLIGDKSGTYYRMCMAALGSLPWVGWLLAGASVASAEAQQGKLNALFAATLEEHEEKFAELQAGLSKMAARVDTFGPEAQDRMQDDSYLDVVRKGFRVWDRCETRDKRERVFTLLTNAASTNLVADDIVRLFLDWVDRYHDAHFGIIRAVHKSKGLTRLDIWHEIGGGELPAENSSQADLFRMLIDDLSRGRVIRQERDWDQYAGRWLRKGNRPRAPRRQASPYTESTWEDSKGYELSELGAEFVRYVLQEATLRVDG